MKKIIVRFLTEKGEQAHWKVEEAGKNETLKNKMIMRKIARDKVTSHKPLVVEIDIKVPRLAIQAKMDELVVQGLEKEGARKDKDFTIEVRWR